MTGLVVTREHIQMLAPRATLPKVRSSWYRSSQTFAFLKVYCCDLDEVKCRGEQLDRVAGRGEERLRWVTGTANGPKSTRPHGIL